MPFWRLGLFAVAAHAQCVTKQLLSPGDGVTFPKPGDTVSMHYTGTLATTGAKFDSSKDRGKEFSTQIGVGQVIEGWDQGVPQMSLGEHAILRISGACGYGAAGSPPEIGPNADLVFEVELNGLNGRRASAGAAPVAVPSAALAAPPVASFGLAAARVPPPALPTCITSSCGHAISFDTTGASRPLCLCNPLCVQMASTPGVLPCCPGLQEICLDPYRSPSPRPASSLSASISGAISANPASDLGSSIRAAASSQVGVSASIPASANIPAVLPTCRPNSCGKAMASGVNSMVAVCACDVSCFAPGSSLPCCQSFREVCQPPVAPSLATQTSMAAQSSAPVPPASVPPAPPASVPPAPPASAPAASSPKPVSGSTSASCALGKTAWSEQPTCDKKRWAIQKGKCKKVCPSVDAQSGIKYYPTGQPGKAACAAALTLCR